MVTIGVENLIVVETGDALLVCARDRSQDVGKAVQELARLKLKSCCDLNEAEPHKWLSARRLSS